MNMHKDTGRPATNFRPRLRPRDLPDALVGLGIALAAFALALPILYGIVTAFKGALGGLPIVLLALASWRARVGRLRLDEEGLHLVRGGMRPRTILWSELSSVGVASRRDVIVRGWLWPPVPFAREMTSSLTSRGHLRFRSARSELYFPPEQLETVLAEIGAYWPHDPQRHRVLRTGVDGNEKQTLPPLNHR